jgi:hypothetical protein
VSFGYLSSTRSADYLVHTLNLRFEEAIVELAEGTGRNNLIKQFCKGDGALVGVSDNR